MVAYLALFVALGGTSVAAVSLKRNSVKGKHIARNAVTAPKVKNASLGAADLAPGTLPSDFYTRGESDARFAPAAAAQPGEDWRPVERAPQDNTPAKDGQFICNSYSGGAQACVIGWRNQDDTFGTAAFRRDGDGFVHLRGTVANTSLGSNTGALTVYRLPEGYRPSAVESRNMLKTTSSTDPKLVLGRVAVQPNGEVQVQDGTTGYYVLDGVAFKAAS